MDFEALPALHQMKTTALRNYAFQQDQVFLHGSLAHDYTIERINKFAVYSKTVKYFVILLTHPNVRTIYASLHLIQLQVNAFLAYPQRC